jgi:four helix bundle protein
MGTSYRDLIAWQKAIQFTKDVYRVSEKFPAHERFGLTSQVRRAAVSIASNIAEGQGRRLPGDFQLFLRHSRGSLLEVETQLIIAAELGYLSKASLDDLLSKAAEEGRILNGLIASIRRSGVEAAS